MTAGRWTFPTSTISRRATSCCWAAGATRRSWGMWASLSGSTRRVQTRASSMPPTTVSATVPSTRRAIMPTVCWAHGASFRTSTTTMSNSIRRRPMRSIPKRACTSHPTAWSCQTPTGGSCCSRTGNGPMCRQMAPWACLSPEGASSLRKTATGHRSAMRRSSCRRRP